MENLLNPVVIAVVLLCVLCLLKINVLLSMLVSLFVAGLVGGMGVAEIKDSLLAGLGGNGVEAVCFDNGLCHRFHKFSLRVLRDCSLKALLSAVFSRSVFLSCTKLYHLT